MKKLIITLDGPAGSGKSTVAKELAHHLGYTYLDTGAMYRAITLSVLRKKIDPEDSRAVIAALSNVKLDIRYENGEQRTFLNGQDVSVEIRTPQVTGSVSQISTIPEVREFLVRQQQSIAQSGGYVLDGRDAGTVIFPKADMKFFLTADVEERARRRQRELAGKNIEVPLHTMVEELQERDETDSTRAVAPLRKADDAVEIDNTKLTVEDQVRLIAKIFEERTGR